MRPVTLVIGCTQSAAGAYTEDPEHNTEQWEGTERPGSPYSLFKWPPDSAPILFPGSPGLDSLKGAYLDGVRDYFTTKSLGHVSFPIDNPIQIEPRAAHRSTEA